MPDKETEKTEKTTITQTEEKTAEKAGEEMDKRREETSGGDPAHDPTQPGPQEK